MTGRYIPASARDTHRCPPPPTITTSMSVGDRWECDDCTGSWDIVLADDHHTLTWLRDPRYTQRRTCLDRWRRRRSLGRPTPPPRGDR